MCRFELKVPIGEYIEPARAITPTGKYERVVFALVISTKL